VGEAEMIENQKIGKSRF